MIEHVVIFKWKPNASPEAIDAVESGLSALKGKIAGLVDLTCGRSFSDRAQGFQTGLVVRFIDRNALDAYGPHAAHQDVVVNLIGPIREDVIVVDYEIGA